MCDDTIIITGNARCHRNYIWKIILYIMQILKSSFSGFVICN